MQYHALNAAEVQRRDVILSDSDSCRLPKRPGAVFTACSRRRYKSIRLVEPLLSGATYSTGSHWAVISNC